MSELRTQTAVLECKIHFDALRECTKQAMNNKDFIVSKRNN